MPLLKKMARIMAGIALGCVDLAQALGRHLSLIF
jgi:hypothetical protein